MSIGWVFKKLKKNYAFKFCFTESKVFENFNIYTLNSYCWRILDSWNGLNSLPVTVQNISRYSCTVQGLNISLKLKVQKITIHKTMKWQDVWQRVK